MTSASEYCPVRVLYTMVRSSRYVPNATLCCPKGHITQNLGCYLSRATRGGHLSPSVTSSATVGGKASGRRDYSPAVDRRLALRSGPSVPEAGNFFGLKDRPADVSISRRCGQGYTLKLLLRQMPEHHRKAAADQCTHDLGRESFRGQRRVNIPLPPPQLVPPAPPSPLPRHQPGAPPNGGMWTWTEAHVGDPSQRAQGMGGYRYRPFVGCGTPHDAAGIRTHNQRPIGDAGEAPTRGPHSTSYRRHSEHRTEGAVRRTGRNHKCVGTHIERRTCLQPVVMDPPGLPYVCTCCSIRVTCISLPLLFVVRVRGALRPLGAPRPPCGDSPSQGPDRPLKGGAFVAPLVTPMKPA